MSSEKMDSLALVASKYLTLEAFQVGDSHAYAYAKEWDLLEDICVHMEGPSAVQLQTQNEDRDFMVPEYDGIGMNFEGEVIYDEVKPNRYSSTHLKWTPPIIHQEALKYTSRTAFHKLSSGAYHRACQLGILDHVCSHMKRARVDTNSTESNATEENNNEQSKPKKIKSNGAKAWTQERIQNIANKYTTRGEFSKGDGTAYQKASEFEILDIVCAHMKPSQQSVPPGYWTIEKCRVEALKYKSRSEFKRKSGSAYDKVWKDGYLDELCAHMKPSIHSVPPGHWTHENIAIEALKYSSRSEFQKGSRSAYQQAWREGLLDLVCSHMKKTTWTVENLHKEALKYKSKDEFLRMSPGAFNTAVKHNLLDQICLHMILPDLWTMDNVELEEIARKYQTMENFIKYDNNAYEYAKGWDMLDEICLHMRIADEAVIAPI